MELIIGQRSFHADGVDQDAQKHQACGGSFKFVGGKGYADLRGTWRMVFTLWAQTDELAGPTVK